MVGLYLGASGAARFTGVPAQELTDRIVALEDLWGPSASAVAANLCELDEETARIGYLETALLQAAARVRPSTTNLDIPGLAGLLWRHRGQVTIRHLAEAAGVSRHHLTRLFSETVGLPPKLYSRLARFHGTLRCLLGGEKPPWAQIAIDMGYADQSHMIAEFRQFSSLTPEIFAGGQWFHRSLATPFCPVQAALFLRINFQIDRCFFPGIERSQRFGAAARALILGLQLVVDIRAQAVEVIRPVRLRHERADLQGFSVLELHHRIFQRRLAGIRDHALNAAVRFPTLFLLRPHGGGGGQEDRQRDQ
jgi:AraC-like DNA-binding protein